MKEPNLIQRRRFLTLIAAAAASSGIRVKAAAQEIPSVLRSVTGPLTPETAGIILPHEHVMSLFGGAQVEKPRYDREALFSSVIPYLKKLKKMGCGTVADCTTAYFGREAELLREISAATGIKILTNTGYYAAANDRYVPPQAYLESAEVLAMRWVKEANQGIGETGIRPGFIKTGVDGSPLSEIDARMVRAAAITHRETGLTIAAHTGADPDSVKQQLQILEEEGVRPSAWIWVHAHAVEDSRDFLIAAEAGAWIELDGVSPENAAAHLAHIGFLRENGFSDQILLSHDGNSFRYGNRPAKPYEGLFTHFIPLLKSNGFSRKEITRLVRENPFRALAPRKRLL